jgi:hypothetical protein
MVNQRFKPNPTGAGSLQPRSNKSQSTLRANLMELQVELCRAGIHRANQRCKPQPELHEFQG